MPINLNSFITCLILFFIYDHIYANHNENLNYYLSNTQNSNTHSYPSKYYKAFFNPNQYQYRIIQKPAYYRTPYSQPAKRDLTKYEPMPIKYDLKMPNEYSRIKYPDDRIKYHPSSYEYKLNDLEILTNQQHDTVLKQPNRNEIVELNTISDNDYHESDKDLMKNKMKPSYEFSNHIAFDDDFAIRPMGKLNSLKFFQLNQFLNLQFNF